MHVTPCTHSGDVQVAAGTFSPENDNPSDHDVSYFLACPCITRIGSSLAIVIHQDLGTNMGSIAYTLLCSSGYRTNKVILRNPLQVLHVINVAHQGAVSDLVVLVLIMRQLLKMLVLTNHFTRTLIYSVPTQLKVILAITYMSHPNCQ